MIGNVHALPWSASMRAALGLSLDIKDSLVFQLDRTVDDAEYPNKIGDQDRVAAGGKVFPGRANAFDGLDQEAHVSDNGALDINQASTDFVLSGWAKANNSGNIEFLFGKAAAGTVDGEYGFLKGTDNVIDFAFATSGGGISVPTSIDGDTDTDLHLFIARIDLAGSKVYIYTDGVLENPGGTSFTGTPSTMINAYEFVIGAGNDTGGSGFTNYTDTQIRDVRVYHKDITSAANLASLQKGERLGDEVAWYPCEGNSLTRNDDWSGNGYHMTNSNFDVTSFVEGNYQSLQNKYGYNNDGGTYIGPDMSTWNGTVPIDDVDGTPLVFAGQAKYNAIARDRSCFIGDGVAYAVNSDWGGIGSEHGAVASYIEFEAKVFLPTGLSGTSRLWGDGGYVLDREGFQISRNSSAYISVELCDGTTRMNPQVYQTAYLDKWVKIVGRYDVSDNKLKLYIDDVLISDQTAVLDLSNLGRYYDLGQSAAIEDGVKIQSTKLTVDGTILAQHEYCEGNGDTVHDVEPGSGNHLTGVNVDDSNWGVIDTPDKDYLAEHGGNFVGKFNGTDDCLDMLTSVSLGANDDFTVVARFKTNSVTAGNPFITDRTASVSAIVNLYRNADDITFRIRGDNGVGLSTVTIPNVLTIGTWHNVVCVRDIISDKIKISIDGSAFTEASDDTTSAMDTIFRIGSDANLASGLFWDGEISEVKIFDSAFTLAQAQAYNDKTLSLSANLLNAQITGIDSEDTFGTWAGTGIHTAIIPALSDKSLDALGQTLVYPQGGKNLIPQTFISFLENIYELYQADQAERYEGGLMDE